MKSDKSLAQLEWASPEWCARATELCSEPEFLDRLYKVLFSTPANSVGGKGSSASLSTSGPPEKAGYAEPASGEKCK